MTREDIARVQGSAPAAAAGAEEPVDSSPSGPPPIPAPWIAKWLRKRGAEIATPYLYAKCAVRYRVDPKTAAPEITLVKLFPLSAEEASDVLEGDVLDATPAELLNSPIEGNLRYASLPAWFGASAIKTLENALSVRLPDKLEATLLRDPVTGSLSLPGESAEAFAGRIAGASAPAALREKLEQKRARARGRRGPGKGERGREVHGDGDRGRRRPRRALREEEDPPDGEGRKRPDEEPDGGGRRSEGRGAPRRDRRAGSEGRPADPSRFESVTVVPPKSSVDLLAVGVAWVA